MPFRKAPGGGFTSPSGKHYTEKQVKLYYATGGFRNPALKQASTRRRKPKVKKRA